MNIGKYIRELRLSKGITSTKLAKLSKHPISTISGIEIGNNKNPRFKIMCDISDALDESHDEMKKVYREKD